MAEVNEASSAPTQPVDRLDEELAVVDPDVGAVKCERITGFRPAVCSDFATTSPSGQM